MRARLFGLVAKRRNTRIATAVARRCRQYLSAYTYRNWDPATNGEERLVTVLSRHSLRIVFDVGAHRGEYARMILRHHPDAVIHCFEVDPKLAAELARSSHAIDGIVVNSFGLGAATSRASLYVDERVPTMTSLIARPGRALPSVEVEIRTGDEYCRSHGIERIDLLKIDCEGFDLPVLHGFRQMLNAGAVPVVQFEYGTFNIYSRTMLIDFYEFLEPFGYRIGKVWPNGVAFRSYAPSDEDFALTNCVAVLEAHTNLIETLRGNGGPW